MVNGSLTGTIRNRAEISDDNNGTDRDSTPDTLNDMFNESPANKNDVIDEHGLSNDEDDHDFEEIVVSIENYDVRVGKKLNTTGTLQSGDTINYTIEYYMSGSNKNCTVSDVYDAHHIYTGLSIPPHTTHNPTTRTITWDVVATG